MIGITGLFVDFLDNQGHQHVAEYHLPAPATVRGGADYPSRREAGSFTCPSMNRTLILRQDGTGRYLIALMALFPVVPKTLDGMK